MSMWTRRLISRKHSPLLKMPRPVVHPSAMPWRSCWWIERSRLTFLPLVKERLVDDRERSVELRLDEQAQDIISGTAAQEQDFDTEFLDYILAVKVVDGVEEAVDHIEAHSTHHSDAIVTENSETAAYFTKQVDSAAVYVNASTRFTDGGSIWSRL